MTRVEHAEQLETPMLGIISANVAYLKGFVMSETSHHGLYGHFRRDKFGVGLGVGYRDINSQPHSSSNNVRNDVLSMLENI